MKSWNDISERERRLVLICAGVAVVVLLFGVLIPLDRSVSKAHARIGQKQTDLAWMRQVEPEIAAAGPPHARHGQESLIVIVDRSARESGLGQSLAGSEPSGAGGLQVRLEKASFDALVAWLARLAQQNGLSVDGATIDNAGTPGIVNAAIILRAH
ncbi:MAG TPA: type II secretion system protein M [Steroidobacteraceae bacterium]|nr:type II secretion system protein M [Steroidobacteraceae bacterium]